MPKLQKLIDESSLLFRYYITNGFTIFSWMLFLTIILKNEPIIADFRTALWFDQLVWLFFVPIIFQAVFPLLAQKKFKNTSLKNMTKRGILASLVFGSGGGFLILSYVFFIGPTLMIIPQDIPVAKNPEINFEQFELMMFLAGHTLSIISTLIQRARKYCIDTKEVELIEHPKLTFLNKAIITELTFCFGVCLFALKSLEMLPF